MTKASLTYKISRLHVLLTVMLCCVLSLKVSAQEWGTGSLAGASSSCQKTACVNSTCQLTLDSAGHLQDDCPNANVKRYDVDPNCVMNKNASSGSCMDTMPVASISRVAETNCYRNEGWERKRNHLGTDYAASEGTVITAAADGTVAFAGKMEGGGRVIILEHEKKCPCSQKSNTDSITGSAACDNKYITVYMHMKAFIVTGGSVKKGTPIGYVGGSSCKNGIIYENAYSPHLHFEIHSGGLNGKTGESARGIYNTLKTSSIINPLCDDIQSFCGGCSYSVEEDCTNKTNTSEWTSLNPDAAASKKVTNPPPGISTGLNQTEGLPSYDGATCDYHKFLLSDDKCFFCPIFKTFFNTASSLAQKTYNALKDAIANLIIVAFALWIAVYILKQVSAFEVKKPSKMIQEMLVQAFKVLLAVLILKTSYAQILKLTLDPVFNTGMNYVQTVTGAGTCSPSAEYMQGLSGYENQMDPSSSGALPLSMGQNILCSIKSMQDAVWRVVAFGLECMCVSWLEDIAYIKYILPHLGYFLTGLFLLIGGLILVLAFPWCLIDCILNMAIAAALLPAAIGAWAFKITSAYLGKLWDFFLNAMFNFVFLSIILYIIITVVNQFLQVIDTFSTEYDKIINPIHGLAFWSVNGLKLIMVCLLGWVFLDKAKGLANEFAEAPSLDIGRKVGSIFAQAGTRLAIGSKDREGKRHGGALGLLKGGADVAGLIGNRVVGKRVRQGISKIRNNRIMNNKNTIKKTDANGNTVYELQRNILGNKITRRVTASSDGSLSYSKDKQNAFSQLQNFARKKANNVRADLIQKSDAKTIAAFDEALEAGHSVQISDDGKIKQIFDENGELVLTQTILDDGSVEITNTEGESKITDTDGNTILKTKRGQSVYTSDGILLSADKTYRNPFLGFKKQNLSIENSAASQYIAESRAAMQQQAAQQAEQELIAQEASQQIENIMNQSAGSINRATDLESIAQTLSPLSGEELKAVYDKLETRLSGTKMQKIKNQMLYHFQNEFLDSNGAGFKVKENTLNALNYESTMAHLQILEKMKQQSYDKSRIDPLYEALQKHKQTLESKNKKTTPSTVKGQIFDVHRTTTSARMGILRAVAPKDSELYDVARTYGIKRDRDLSSPVGKTATVSKDHILSVRQIKDENGRIIQEDYALNSQYAKFLIRRDGSIDKRVLDKILAETNQSPEDVYTALTELVLKDRRIKLNHKFTSRSTSFDDGVLTIVQQNFDGSITRLSTQEISNQMIVDMEIVDHGNVTHIFDNGTISRVISQRPNEKPSSHYEFNDHIVNNSSVEHLINYAGQFRKFAPGINEEAAMIGLTKDDITLFATQEYDGRNQIYDQDLKGPERYKNLQKYMNAYNFRCRSEQKVSQILNELNKTKQELDTLISSKTQNNTPQLAGKENLLQQKLQQIQFAYNNAVSEYQRFVRTENDARSDLEKNE